jgi:uncharacterized protein
MDVTPLLPKGAQTIQSYGGGMFRISDVEYQGSVMVFPDHTEAWPVTDLAACDVESLSAALASDPLPEMVLIGCGQDFQMLPKALRQAFRAKGIPAEAMDTGAACRTYNILLSEGRRVVAALIAV